MKRRITIGVVARFPSGSGFKLKSRPDVLSVCHCLVTVFREGCVQRYLTGPGPERGLGLGGIQGPECTGLSVGR